MKRFAIAGYHMDPYPNTNPLLEVFTAHDMEQAVREFVAMHVAHDSAKYRIDEIADQGDNVWYQATHQGHSMLITAQEIVDARAP